MKKILITGAAGMLGHAISHVFSDYELILTDRDELDITNPENVTDFVTWNKPDCIINTAAYTNVDACEDEANRNLCMELNGNAVGYLAKAASANHIPFVHFSTDYVFSGSKQGGYDEFSQPETPVNVYGASKKLGEEQLMKNTDTFYLIRTQWLYGRHGKNFVDTMIKLAGEKEKLTVVNDQFGSPTWTHDLALFTRSLFDRQIPFGVYHGVNSGTTTWYEFTQEIFRIKGITTPVEPVDSSAFPRPAKRPAYSTLLSTKVAPMRSWQEAVAEYLVTA